MRAEFKLKGLGKRSDGLGVYATLDTDKEDSFSALVDESYMSVERQYALFDYMQSFGESTIGVIQFDRYGSVGIPIDPLLISIKNIK